MPTKNHVEGIYVITNTANEKKYIGQSKSCNTRWRSHKYLLKNRIHYNKRLQSDYDAFGLDFFYFSILENCTADQRPLREKYWIDFYKSNSIEKGYNLESGGLSGYLVSDETRKKISKIHKGKILSDSQKEIAIKNLNCGEPWNKGMTGEKMPMYGKKHSRETRDLMSRNCSGEKNHRFGKKVSEETRQKMREAHTGKTKTLEHRKNLSLSKKGKNATPITEAMIEDKALGMKRKDWCAKWGFGTGIWQKIKVR